MAKSTDVTQISEPLISKFIFADTKFSIIWLLLRIYVGWEWLVAGYEKLINSSWTGSHAGTALIGFLQGSLVKTAGAHPDVSMWYAVFIKSIVMPQAATFSYLIAYGEFLVGVALILGIFTGIAAFFGSFMNMNYLFAGTVSTNPVMFLIELFLILAWRTAGWIGLDRYILPLLGTPWQPGKIFKK